MKKQIQVVGVEDLRAKNINKQVCVEGYLVAVSEIRPRVISARYECKNCGAIIQVEQVTKELREPTKCACRKGSFELLSRELFDCQLVTLSDIKKCNKETGPCGNVVEVFLYKKLTDPKLKIFDTFKKKARVKGILLERPIMLENGRTSVDVDFYIDAQKLEIL